MMSSVDTQLTCDDTTAAAAAAADDDDDDDGVRDDEKRVKLSPSHEPGLTPTHHTHSRREVSVTVLQRLVSVSTKS